MNLSKMVAQDVPLFLSLLRDLFPKLEAPPVADYEDIEAAIKEIVEQEELIHYEHWVRKVIQLYETHEVSRRVDCGLHFRFVFLCMIPNQGLTQ